VTGATSHLLELSLTQRRKLLTLERVLKMASYEDKPLFLRNGKSGKVALAIPAPSHMDEEGELIRRFELVRPLRSEYILAGRLDETAWEPATKAAFSALWEAEYAADEEPARHRNRVPRHRTIAADLGRASEGGSDGQPHRYTSPARPGWPARP
jgi:hypothetical protein